MKTHESWVYDLHGIFRAEDISVNKQVIQAIQADAVAEWMKLADDYEAAWQAYKVFPSFHNERLFTEAGIKQSKLKAAMNQKDK